MVFLKMRSPALVCLSILVVVAVQSSSNFIADTPPGEPGHGGKGILEVSGLRILDSDGRARIELLCEDGIAQIVINDQKGNLVRTIAVFEDGACQDAWTAGAIGKPLVLVDIGAAGRSVIKHQSEVEEIHFQSSSWE